MSKIIVLPGTIVGRAHLDHPKDTKGDPVPQDIVDNVTLTIQPTTALVQSGEFKVLVDDLHVSEFQRDSTVELIVAPEGWAALADEDDADFLKEHQALKTANTSLQSQLTVMTQRAESAEGVVATRDGEISVLKAELARAQNALAAKPTGTVMAGTTAPAEPTTIPTTPTTTGAAETKS